MTLIDELSQLVTKYKSNINENVKQNNVEKNTANIDIYINDIVNNIMNQIQKELVKTNKPKIKGYYYYNIRVRLQSDISNIVKSTLLDILSKPND